MQRIKPFQYFMNKYNTYKICFVCTGNACRSPFAECVTKALLDKEGIKGVEIFSLGTLDWGKNPRDTVMADMAQQMGYCLTGSTTHMTRERLMDATVLSFLKSIIVMLSLKSWIITIGIELCSLIR